MLDSEELNGPPAIRMADSTANGTDDTRLPASPMPTTDTSIANAVNVDNLWADIDEISGTDGAKNAADP